METPREKQTRLKVELFDIIEKQSMYQIHAEHFAQQVKTLEILKLEKMKELNEVRRSIQTSTLE